MPDDSFSDRFVIDGTSQFVECFAVHFCCISYLKFYEINRNNIFSPQNRLQSLFDVCT